MLRTLAIAGLLWPDRFSEVNPDRISHCALEKAALPFYQNEQNDNAERCGHADLRIQWYTPAAVPLKAGRCEKGFNSCLLSKGS